MKSKSIFFKSTTLVLGAMMAFSSCEEKKDETPVVPPVVGSKVVILSTDIKGTRNLVKDSIYLLKGEVHVDSLAVLNIAAGTIIKGDKLTKGSLIVLQGAKINAIGTSTSPIVFTSAMDPGLRSPGDWGGLVIVGRAKCNQTSASVEGLSRAVTYGGRTDDADNSGTLQYVRIEFGGIALQPDKEINGLTLCAVGSGTTIDHVQVSHSGDDSFEWFGGKVNAKYLIAYRGTDDEFDTDYGFTGNIQFALGVRDPRLADVSTSNGFESDNDATGTAAEPKTMPVFSNVTLIGAYKTKADKNVNGQFGAGMHIRRNSSLSAFNSVFAGWKTGFLLDGTTTYANTTASNLCIQNCALIGMTTADVTGAGITTLQATEFYNTPSYSNTLVAENVTAKIANSFYDASKTGIAAIPTSFMPEAGSALLGGASFTNAKVSGSFFTATTYIGAFGTTDWTKEAWVNFDAQNTVY